jgi:regulator of cell morphogenesis and NO signaling
MATTTQTVRDIATENPGAVRVFEKYGIDSCCGGRVPLAEACATRNLDVDEVIASLGAVRAPAASGTQKWTKESLATLATYIVDTHHVSRQERSWRVQFARLQVPLLIGTI